MYTTASSPTVRANAISQLISPLDDARVALLRATCRVPLVPRLLRDRPLRMAVTSSLQLTVAFLVCAVAPLWSLLFAPLILGVPHVASDLRYLCLRSTSAVGAERPGGLRLAGVGILLGSAAAVHAFPGAFHAVLPIAAWLVAVAAGLRGLSLALASVGATGLILLGAFAPVATTTGWAHGHHLIALGLAAVVVVARVRRGLLLLPVAVLVVATLALLSGVVDPWLAVAPVAPGMHLAAEASWLAPGVPQPLATRVVAAFAFWQAAHYGAWLGLVPDAARDGDRPRSWKRTARDLVDDFGPFGLALLAAATLAFLLGAVAAPNASRSAYLTLAVGHGALELGVLAVWLASPGGLRRAPGL